MFALTLDTDNRVLSARPASMATPDNVIVDAIPINDICDYIYEDGEFVYSEAPWKASERIRSEVNELKAKLTATDYVACKIAEGAATVEEYAETIAQRQQWRERINELEN